MSDAPHHRSHGHPSARATDAQALEQMIQDRSPEVLEQAASSPGLNEDLALALLTRRDIPQRILEVLSKNRHVMKHRKVILGVVSHVKTPRHITLPIVRHLYTFELMQVALTPAVPADVKRAIEDVIVGRLETVSSGERLTLAKRGSTRVAAALLLDKERQVMEAALQNPYLTEQFVIQAIKSEDATQMMVEAISHHVKWSLRQDVRIELLKHEYTPLARVLHFSQTLPGRVLREVLVTSRLSESVKEYLTKELEARAAQAMRRLNPEGP